MLFRRSSPESRCRYFIVQYDAGVPIFNNDCKQWKKIKPDSLFSERNDGKLYIKERAIYSVILTKSISLKECEITAVNHNYCVSKKCEGRVEASGKNILKRIARE